MAKLIGLHGKMHTGKSAVAKLIKQKDPNRIEIMSFAGKLREVLNVLGIQETRESMQQVGQSLRDIWPDVWVKAVHKDVQRRLNLGHSVIFDDLRYLNEFDYVREENGLLVKLYADEEVRWDRYQKSSKWEPGATREKWNYAQTHSSELELDDKELDWNLAIDTNNLSKRDMNGVADALVISLQGMRNINDRRNLDS